MKISLRLLTLVCACLVWASTASAQATPQSTEATRPAAPTFFGDTGLWFAPTAEIVPAGRLSVSGQRRATNYFQGLTNVSDFAGTFSFGVGNRLEVFGSFLFDTRIDRELKPIFANDAEYGSFLAAYPRVNQSWTGDHVGDLYVGGKLNFWSQFHQRPAALAVRVVVKVPTGDDEVGVSTGKTDALFDFVVSKYTTRRVEATGYFGFETRGEPEGFTTPSSAIRWGAGVGVPFLGLRGTAEINGTLGGDDGQVNPGTLIFGDDGGRLDGSVLRGPAQAGSLTRATLGATWHHRSGFFIGAAGNLNLPAKGSDNLALGLHETYDPDSWDFSTLQVRLGYHPGVRVYVPPPPPPPPPAAAAAGDREAAPPHTLAVQAQCDPCTVEVGRSSTVTAVAKDSIGCAVTYQWTAPTGTFATGTQPKSLWTAPQQEGVVPVTVTVTCPTDKVTATSSVNITVTRPPVKTYTFEDVYFEFDRYTLRPEAARVLDEAIAAMAQDATLRLQIEGHTCNIGTAEYNLALGDRRASSVREYLLSRGVAAARLTSVSYGEERPKHDNTREETRRLNRRAALTVNLTQ